MNGVYSDWAVTLPADWLAFLATGSARMALYRMQGLHGPLRLLHLLATATFFGGILVLDLRLLGIAGRDIAAEALSRLVLPAVHLGFAVLLVTGAALFLFDPIQTGSHTWFLPKLALVALGMLNAAAFSRPWQRTPRTARAARHASLAALLSVLVWSATIACATANEEERPVMRHSPAANFDD